MASRFRFDGKEYTKRFEEDERRAYIGECLCAATGLLFFVPLVSAPDSEYGKFWANQGLITLIIEALCLVVGLLTKLICWLLSLIPVIGFAFDILHVIIVIALWLVAIFYVVYGIYFVAKRRAKNLPFFGYMRFIK